MAEKDPNCIFCKIVSGELGAEKVYEDDEVLAFLDIHPSSRGHTLLIPKQHYDGLLSTPPEMLQTLVAALPKVASAVVTGTGAEGFNVLQSNGPCSGQMVFHIHFHIVPRNSGDGIGLGFRSALGGPIEDDLSKTAEAVRAAF